jgi:hypothetical protein
MWEWTMLDLRQAHETFVYLFGMKTQALVIWTFAAMALIGAFSWISSSGSGFRILAFRMSPPTTTTVFRAQGKSAMSRLPTEKMRAFSGMKGTNVFSFVWVERESFCGLLTAFRRSTGPIDENRRFSDIASLPRRWEVETRHLF